MILGRYLARRFLMLFLWILAAFAAILLLIDVIDQLRKSSVGLKDALHLSLLNIPESLYQILPLLVLLTALAFFIALARSSELVVIRAAGRSGLRLLLPPLAVAAAIGFFAVAVLDPLVAATSKAYDRLQTERSIGADAVMSISSDGLWMRQGNAGIQTVIRATGGNADGSQINGMTFVSFTADGKPKERIEAKSARLVSGAWELSDAKQWDLTADNPEQLSVVGNENLRVITELSADRIRNSFGEPSSVAFWNLPSQINYLEAAGFSSRNYAIWMHMELALPLLLVAMVLIAAGFTMRHVRFGKTGQMVILALMGGFVIFFLRNFAQVLGENGQIPVLLAAWGPPTAAAMMALGLLLHLEDG